MNKRIRKKKDILTMLKLIEHGVSLLEQTEIPKSYAVTLGKWYKCRNKKCRYPEYVNLLDDVLYHVFVYYLWYDDEAYDLKMEACEFYNSVGRLNRRIQLPFRCFMLKNYNSIQSFGDSALMREYISNRNWKEIRT